jgi:hypothetical protein
MHLNVAGRAAYDETKGRLMKQVWGNRNAVTFVVMLVVGLYFFPSLAKADESALLKKDFPVLTERVKVAEPADYVIAIDKSKSMNRFWPSILSSLSAFVGSIPDGNYVSIVAFGNSASYLVTPAPIDSQTRGQIQAALARLPSPPDNNTDLGAGVAKVLEELYRPGGNRLKFVFFLTDFKAEPPQGSPYESAMSPISEPWAKLVNRRRKELTDKILDVQAFVLNLGEGGVGRDLNLVQAVFPELLWQHIDTPSALAAWFERRQAEIARSKLRVIVRQDMTRPPLTALAIESAAPLLGDTSEIYLRASSTDGAAAVGALSHIELSVSGEGALGLTQFQRAPLSAVLPMTGGEIRIPIGTITWTNHPWLACYTGGRLDIRVKGTWEAQPVGEIQRLDLDPEIPFTLSASLPVICKHGRVPLWLAGIWLALILVLATGLAYRYRPEYLHGELIALGLGKREISRGERLKRLAVGNITAGEGWAVPGVPWRLILRAVRTGEEKGLSRGVYVRVDQGAATLTHPGSTHQTCGTTWVALARGCMIEVGGSRLTWN